MSTGSYTRDWDKSLKLDHSKFKTQPSYPRDVMDDVAQRLSAFFYGFLLGETTKGVKYLELCVQSTHPSSVADAILLYGLDVGTQCEAHLLHEGGSAIQLTDQSKIKTTDTVKLTGDQTVAGVKTFSSVPLLPGSDPTTDNEASRKKYIDDSIVINTETEKTALHANDLFLIEDSEASNARKKITAANVCKMGAYASKTNNTNYLAETDGFAMGYATYGGGEITAYVEAGDSTPDIERQYDADTEYTDRGYGVCVPVAKGEYWKITATKNAGGGSIAVWWKPTGS